jgi:hypothetical protein
MDRVDPRNEAALKASDAATTARIKANLKAEAEMPLNVPRLLFHSVSAAMMVGSYMGLKVWMSSMPVLEDNVSIMRRRVCPVQNCSMVQ